jgi:hypothetical protein
MIDLLAVEQWAQTALEIMRDAGFDDETAARYAGILLRVPRPPNSWSWSTSKSSKR